MAIIAALPKRATIHGDTIQVLPDITRDFSSDNYLNILRESGDFVTTVDERLLSEEYIVANGDKTCICVR